MWHQESVFYQIYPLGMCGTPPQNDGVCVPRIRSVEDWAEHITRLGANAIYFSPVFESDAHGYDTRDYAKIDCRLGTNDDFAAVCARLHRQGIRVVLDGVFNHAGRGFWAFQDVLKQREASPYKDWFYIDFGGNSNYNDGLWYEGWEGHYELVKLNLQNDAVVGYLFGCIEGWVRAFDIDGLRLDVAYCLDEGFLRRLHGFCAQLKPDFFLLGEMLHGDYTRLVNDAMLDSATNYECYKGLYSSFNTMNLFEIAHSLQRQFGPEQWTLYKGKHLFNFGDNHDVTRLASVLENPAHLPLVYGLLFAMPGIPCVYYGSEWEIAGEKKDGDAALRPAAKAPRWLEGGLTDWIAKLARAHKESRALCYGSYRTVLLTNHQFVFERALTEAGERVLVAINASNAPYDAHFDAGAGCADDLITGAYHDFGGGSTLPPYSVAYWKVK